MNSAPEAFESLHAVLGQPGFELAVGAHFLLQGLERLDTGAQIGQLGRFLVHGALARAAVFVECGHLLLQILQSGFGLGRQSLGLSQLFLQVAQPGLVGRSQGVAVGQQAFAALLQLARLFFHVALLSRQHANLLLHLHHGGALGGGVVLGFAQGFFQIGQRHGLVFDLGGQGHALVFGHGRLLSQGFQLGLGVLAAGAPLGGLFHQLLQALLGALSAFHHKADFGLQPPHFGAGFVQLALRLVDLVTCGVMRLANGFQIGLDVAQIGHARFERVHGLVHIRLHAALVGLGIAALQKPQLVLLERAVGLQLVVAGGDFGLLFQLFQIRIQLAQDVVNPGQVLAGVGQAIFGFAAALFVFGHARSFFEEQAQLFRARLDDAADRPLADDGVGAGPETRAQKHVLHVAAAHGLVVDVITAVAVTGEHTLDGDFGKLAPLTARTVVFVAEHQLHTGTAGRFAGGGAVEDDVLHGLATQLRRFGLAQYPTHRIHDVRFAATVGPDHAHQLPGQQEVGRFGKRFEA